jgi:hypothetical protein
MNYEGAIQRLREIEIEKRSIVEDLQNEVSKDARVLELVRAGVVRLNFPTTTGFRRYLNTI